MTARKLWTMMTIGVVLMLLTATSDAQVPRKINYQGYLTDSVTGLPVNDDVDMTFAIYDVASGGTALWTETRTVTVTDGQYSVQLGENTPIDLLEPKSYWLGVQIGTDPELTPREELTSVLYALFAKYLEGITIKDGKVGIGTDDPQEMLDVHGNAHIRGTLHVGPNSFIFNGDEMPIGQDPSNGVHMITTETPETDQIYFKIEHLETSGNLSVNKSIHAESNITANGQIKGNEVCIGNSCLDAWPDPCACLPECANGQTLIYNGRTAKWECDGEPVPIVTTKPLYRHCLGYSDECNGTANNTDHWSNHIDSPDPNALDYLAPNLCQRNLGSVLTTQISGTKPLYKIYRSHDASNNDIKDDHMTTDNVSEINTFGGTNEGIMGYVYTTQVSGTIPLYRKYRQYWYTLWGGRRLLHTDHITSTDPNEGSGWVTERILGYIVKPSSSSCP